MRLFAAVVPDAAAVAHLEAFLEPRRTAADFRWSPAEQFHVTLAFVADAEPWRVEEYVERLTGAVGEVPAGSAALAGAIAFPHPDATRVLAVGLDGDPDLLARLATRTRSAAVRCGLEVDGQRFRPHLTVARLRRPAGTTGWVCLLDDYAGPAWPVDAVRLVASHLGEGPRRGPRHEVLAELALGAAPH